jgi:hypothetical protein
MYNVLVSASFTAFIAASLTGVPMFTLVALLLSTMALGIAVHDYKHPRA